MACPVPKYHRKGMARRPERKRLLLPNVWNFCTSRTRAGEYRFSELEAVDRLVLWGFIGFAAQTYGVQLAFLTTMSNHLHLICRAPIPEAISLFHGHFKAQFARYLNRKYGRTGAVWAGRFHNINLLDEEAQKAALTYGIDHGTKEALVERPDEWHLPHTIKELCGDGWLRGHVWRRQVGKRKGQWRQLKERLIPLDPWRDDRAGYREFIKTLLEDRVQHYIELRAAQRTAWLKARREARKAGEDPNEVLLPNGRLNAIIRQQDFVPRLTKRSRATRFKALGPDRKAELEKAQQAHREACEAYEQTVVALSRGELEGEPTLPEGYQWPTAIAAALEVGVIQATWAEIFERTSAIPPGAQWASAG